MRETEWYVIQVETGREQQTCDAIKRACNPSETVPADSSSEKTSPLLRECFAPRYVGRIKLRGAWVDEERLLLPGYVVAVTSDAWGVFRKLRGVKGFTKMLTMGETFAPLSSSDRAWIERWTSAGNRTIPLSVAYKANGKIIVTDGPLEGHEAMIERVNRRKNLAFLTIHAGQITVHTTVGLAILPKPEG